MVDTVVLQASLYPLWVMTHGEICKTSVGDLAVQLGLDEFKLDVGDELRYLSVIAMFTISLNLSSTEAILKVGWS